MPLVVLDVPGVRMRPAEVEALRSRIRTKSAILVVTGGDWARRPHLGIHVRHVGADGIGRGRGRVRQLLLEVKTSVGGQTFRRGRIALTGTDEGHTRWIQAREAAAAPRLGLAQTG